MECRGLNRQSFSHKHINSSSIGNKTNAKLFQFRKEQYDDDSDKKYPKVNDLKLLSGKMVNEHLNQLRHKQQQRLKVQNNSHQNSHTSFNNDKGKDKDNHNNLFKKTDGRIKAKKRQTAQIQIGYIKKIPANSLVVPGNNLIRNNKSTTNVYYSKRAQRLQLFYHSYDDNKQYTSVKINQQRPKEKNRNCGNPLINLPSSAYVIQSKIYHTRREECKNHKQYQSTITLKNQVMEIMKNHNRQTIAKEIIDGISPIIKDIMKKRFKRKNKSKTQTTMKQSQSQKQKQKQSLLEEKDSIKNVPLLWQLKYHRNMSVKNILTPLNKEGLSPSKYNLFTPQMRNSKKTLPINDNTNTHFNYMNEQNILIINENNYNDDEANVIVTTANNQCDNASSICHLPICASKKIFFPLDSNELATVLGSETCTVKEANLLSLTSQFPFCFSNDTISNCITSYFSIEDIISLSLTNCIISHSTKKIRYNIIKSKILSLHNETIHDSIWKQMMTHSKLNRKSESALKEIFNKNASRQCLYLSDIQKDIRRTYPHAQSFNEESIEYHQLINVLTAYANYDRKIGYAQGMNFIAAKIYQKCKSTHQSFLILDAIMQRLQMEKVIGVSNSITTLMDSIGTMIKNQIPSFDQFLSSHMLTHEICTANWILTLFSNSVSNSHLNIIWEFIFIFGWSFINCFVLSIIKAFQDTIIAFSFDNFSDNMKLLLYSDSFIKEFNHIIDFAFNYMLNDGNYK